ncbi:MAG: pirin family protein [Actinomycetota bacterium]
MAGITNGATHVDQSVRRITRIIEASRTIEGGGFEVYGPFPGQVADRFDPFLLLDEMAPRHQHPGEAIGAPAHPHRGFETVTYVLRGEVEHRDSAGNHGVIGPGDVQWMTAGDGIVHSEMPSTRIQTEGGVGHGVQLWVNLPASLRRTPPKYQALLAGDLASVCGPGWSADVVAGSMLGVEGPASTHTPIGVARVTIEPGSTLHVPTTDGHTALVYCFGGAANVGAGGEGLRAHHLAVLADDGGAIVLTVDDDDASEPFECVVLTGEPIGEPMVRSGPFVMNTSAEIDDAISDFSAGRMGTIPATGTT